MGRLAPGEGQVESLVSIASRLLLFFTKGALKTNFKEPEPLYYCSLSRLRLSLSLHTQVCTVPEAAVTSPFPLAVFLVLVFRASVSCLVIWRRVAWTVCMADISFTRLSGWSIF